MCIKLITPNDLRRMENYEGLILQGCGGDLQEWLDGVNKLLTDDGILQNGSKFTECLSFEHEGVRCLLFTLKNVDINLGRLAMWRLQTHDSFGGTWLSDYVPNRLGGFEVTPPNEAMGQTMQ